MKCLLICVFLGPSLLLSGAETWDKPDPSGAGMSSRRLALIPVRMREFVDEGKTAGTVTIVARHGKVASFEAVGYQDLESKTPMQRDSMFRIMSLTKPVTCAGIMVLADEGKLSVIDPVERYLPEYKGLLVNGCGGRTGYGCEGVAPSRPVNIEDLMVHTSGMASDVEIPEGVKPSSLAELARLGARMRLLFDPGTHWNYSNAGYDVLGRIIEVVSKQPYDVFLKERIFEPLGMKDTSFFLPDAKQKRVATLYTLTSGGLKAVAGGPPATIPMPAGGLLSTAADMLRFNLMMLNKGTLDGHRVLSAAAVELMTTSHTGDMPAGWSPGVGHGYGYEVVRDAAGMFRYNSIGSFVKGGAYRTYEWVDTAKDMTGVLMMQLTNGGGDTADEINRFLQMSAAAVE
jgi:CubicO group peptidase (beta-lactamase class C family)